MSADRRYNEEEVLGDLEWKARSAMGGRYVSIRSEGDRTRIRVLGNYRDSLMVSTLGAGPILAASIGALAAALGAVGAPVIVPIALVGAARRVTHALAVCVQA